ncbi:O-methyltransferase [Fulvivirga sp. RKSG066]|uniref:O-methyltransferase n=1 Tax=Fulvivirga aurantia TaxID=2529383 RepID=UPI0012BD319A|nr:class I SAM-dependent methyltransferase [Fulvivirga aurantia]MTI20406.1 O-methyltransferase [Fulvivirga aurantia]
MEFLPEAIDKYVAEHTAEENQLLKEINRETHAKVMMPRMLSGHVQGRVLSTFAHMIKPKTVLEIGTYTGYSAICMAEGLAEDGKLYTLDINEELEDMVRAYIEKAGFKEKIDYRIGNALDLIPDLKESFDLVFIDADKINYSNYYDLVIDKVNKGGFIIADNVLWSGKVVGDKIDKDTQALLDFNAKVHNDDRVENVLFPVRDGLMVLRKL